MSQAPPRAAAPLPSDRSPAEPTSPAAAAYRARCARFAAERDRLDRRLQRVGYARLGVFFIAAALLVGGLVAGALALVAAAGVALVTFVALVVYHERVGRIRRRYATLHDLDAEALCRLARDWDGLPQRSPPPEAASHAFAGDLDLFGRASVFQLLGAVSTPPGEATLGRWLLRPASPAVIRERQAAVAELAPLLDLRDELALRGRLMGGAGADPEPFLEWAEGEPWLTRRPAVLWGARALSFGACVLLLAQLGGLLAEPWWLLFAAANVALSQTAGKQVDLLLDRVASQAGAVEHYAEVFATLAGASFQAPLLGRLQAALGDGPLGAARQTRALARRVRLTYLRLSMFYWPIQTLTLWNFHTLALLEGWQAHAGRQARGWLAALGETEALAALASLAHDEPTWAFPTIAEDEPPRFVACGLGHPLLPDAVRVANDVTVGPPGTFLLVTGSNMSGKSTLLRAIGVNAVLAQAGGPVCAAALRLPPVTLGTSIRVQDSLEQGVSYYMAELQRLKEVVDLAERAQEDGARTLLFLLDEILQGTNTAERQIAARRVILHLVANGAIGAVSTHDLTLAEHPAMAAAAQPIHFTEQFHSGPDGPSMSFDYTIRPGVATSTNALKLMQLVGLDLDEGDWR
ncbi:MAG TPA: DNA mismatch repair protein MutS [Chloroflexota bacterium]|nr:DNA mismatch repair protein MutS [Chloroflexota bacterium]